jgi:hypothetical protein
MNNANRMRGMRKPSSRQVYCTCVEDTLEGAQENSIISKNIDQ